MKTKNSYRAVTISQQAIEVLKQQKAKTNDTYVFPSPNGAPISPDSVNNMLKRVLERAGIPKVRFHNLRHSCATILLYLGYSMKDIQTWLGHSNYAFTANTYLHSSKDSHIQMARPMSENLPTLGPATTVTNMDFPMLEASFSGSKTQMLEEC